MDMNFIEWKKIKHFDGEYSASTNGKIRRNVGFDSIGRAIKETILRPSVDSGKPRVCIYCKKHLVSRLVAITFLNGGGEEYQVRHYDKNPLNNNVCNLYWLHIADDKGVFNGYAKLTEDDVIDIKTYAHQGRSSKWISKKKKISQGHVRRLITGESWGHIINMKDNSKNGNCHDVGCT